MEYKFSNYTQNGNQYHILCVKDIPPVQNLPLNIKQIYKDAYEDMIVEHHFCLSEKIKETTDEEGFWYAWYNVSEYERVVYERNIFELKEKGRWKYV